MRYRVVVADDHAIVLEGLKHLLEGSFDVVRTVPDGHALVEACQQLKPDIAVSDISMPLLNGLDALRQLRSSGCPVKFVFLTAHSDVPLATQALQLGASAFVLKHSAGSELLTAIQAALNGHTYIAPSIAADVLLNVMGRRGRQESTLTARERQVLQLLAEGKTFKEAAAVLEVSARTIEFHRNNIAEKTGLRTTAELSRHAARLGLVSDTD